MQNWNFLEDKWLSKKVEKQKKDKRIGFLMFSIGFFIAFVIPLFLADINNLFVVN